MIVYKCDLCGKASKPNMEIVDRELQLQLPSKLKENLNFYITIKVEREKTVEALNEFENLMTELNIVKEEDIEFLSRDEMTTVMELQEKTNVEIEHDKNTFICEKCKKEVLKLGLSYGSFDEMRNLQDI